MLSSYEGGAWYRVVIIKTPKNPLLLASHQPALPALPTSLLSAGCSHTSISQLSRGMATGAPKCMSTLEEQRVEAGARTAPTSIFSASLHITTGKWELPTARTFPSPRTLGKTTCPQRGLFFLEWFSKHKGTVTTWGKESAILKNKSENHPNRFFVLLPHTLAGLPCY